MTVEQVFSVHLIAHRLGVQQRVPLCVKRLAGPLRARRRRQGRPWVIVKGQIPLELDGLLLGVMMCGFSTMSVVVVISIHTRLACLQPGIRSLQDLSPVLVYLIADHVGRLQTNLGPLGRQGPRVRWLGVVQQSLVLVQDPDLHFSGCVAVICAAELTATRSGQAGGQIWCRGTL